MDISIKISVSQSIIIGKSAKKHSSSHSRLRQTTKTIYSLFLFNFPNSWFSNYFETLDMFQLVNLHQETTFCNIICMRAYRVAIQKRPLPEWNMSNVLRINFTNSHFHYTDYILITIWDMKQCTQYNAHVPLLPLPFIYPAYSEINTLIYYVYYVPINFQLVTSTQYFQIINNTSYYVI